jgi:uncharacterized RDD family membrane protein YckC
MTKYAGVLHRILAVIIDTVILGIVALVIAIPIGVSALFSAGPVNPFMMAANVATWIAFGTIIVVIWLLYFPYFESTTGQTLGKKVMGIKVVKENGKKLTFGDALIRTIFRIIDMLPAAYIIGLIVILVSEKKQRIGDMAAKTIVVMA